MDGIEPSTSPLPRVCSTPELHERKTHQLERAAGIEPAPSAWKAEVLPLNYARLTTARMTSRRTPNVRQYPLPAFIPQHDQIMLLKSWWRGKDSNLRSFRGRFTVCSLWPLGNPSNVAAHYASHPNRVKIENHLFHRILRALLALTSRTICLERAALCQSSIENARPARIFSSTTGSGTRGAPDILPARSASVSGKQASSPP